MLMPILRSPFLLLLLALSFVTSIGYAQSCQGYLFPYSVKDVTVAVVNTAHEPILHDGDGCPGNGASCASHAYLVAGNRVLVSHAQGAYRCIAFFNGTQQTTGWVRSEALSPATPNFTAGQWQGIWKRNPGPVKPDHDGFSSAKVVIQRRNDAFHARALATLTVRPDNVRTGTAQGKLDLQGDTASLDDAVDGANTCHVSFRLFEDVLLVDDGASDNSNSLCGGMGVTLNGIYRRSLK